MQLPADHTAPVIPHDTPSWAAALFQELHLIRLENAALREAVGCHLVSRRQAAAILDRDPKTLRRWEIQNILEPIAVSAPGTWYDHGRILELKRTKS